MSATATVTVLITDVVVAKADHSSAHRLPVPLILPVRRGGRLSKDGPSTRPYGATVLPRPGVGASGR